MNTLQKQRILEHTIYAIIAWLIFATPIINALLMIQVSQVKKYSF